MKIIQIDERGLDDQLITELKSKAIFSPSPEHFSLAKLVASGVQIHPISELRAGENDVLLIPLLAGPLDHLVGIVDRLLGPGGCPWDQAQTHDSLKKYLLEEAYEVIDAIEQKDDDSLLEELGDLLLQPVMHGQIRQMAGGFSTYDAASAIVRKLIHRHPHVFGETKASTPEEVLVQWDALKSAEKVDSPRSILAGVPRSMPALQRAYEVSKRAARSGFEFDNLGGVLEKLNEEVKELKEAHHSGDPRATKAELGDLLFTIVNIARWLKIEPEEALRQMVDRFTWRFQFMESHSSKPLRELSASEWDGLWNQAKASEASSHTS